MSRAEELEPVIEAVLFVASEPVSRDRLLEVFDPRQREAAAEAIDAVVARYAEAPERGFMIDEVAGGFRLVSRPDLHGYLRRFFEISGANKLSMAALETLAIIAYRQPTTGPEIQELRGVSSSGVLKTLLERRLVRIAGRKEVVGKPFLYATTREFLMHFGLRTLKELPPLEEFEELYASEAADLEPGLDHEPGMDHEAGMDHEVGMDHEESVLKESAALDEAAEEAEDQQVVDEVATESMDEVGVPEPEDLDEADLEPDASSDATESAVEDDGAGVPDPAATVDSEESPHVAIDAERRAEEGDESPSDETQIDENRIDKTLAPAAGQEGA
jgi:segregation and condensation protein B